MKHKLLVVDLQVFQSPAWDRGMGKFTLELMSEVVKLGSDKGWENIRGLLSANAENQKDMKRSLTQRLGDLHIEYLDLLPDEIGNPAVPEHNRAVIDAYIESCLGESEGEDWSIDYFVPSPMQGFICSPLPSDHPRVKKIALAHDLIPLAFHGMYLESPITRQEYLSRIKDFLRADVYVTNSQTTANDLVTFLNIDRSRIQSIDGGPADHAEKPEAVLVPHPFILMPTGNDLRKNNERAVRAFEDFNQKQDNKYRLVITSYFKDFQIEYLSGLSDNIIFTGNLSGPELSYLFKKAVAVLFPPEYEGLGMPILEALEYNKPVACSNIAVFREISATAFTYFDPYSVAEMSAALMETIEHPHVDKRAYAKILRKYSWPKTAEKFAAAASRPLKKSPSNLSKIAVFSPSPSGDSKAGEFSQGSHAENSRLLNIEYYLGRSQEPLERRINYLPYITSCSEIGAGMNFDAPDYDEIIYHIDNTAESAEILFTALSNPGIVVLHSLKLFEVWKTMVARKLIDKTRLEAEKAISRSLGEKSCSYLYSLLATQRAVVVFSKGGERAVKATVQKVNPDLLVHTTALPVAAPAYPQVVVQKTVATVKASDIVQKQFLTDYLCAKELAQSKTLAVDMPGGEALVLDAMRYGTVPCVLGAVAEELELPEDARVAVADLESSYAAAEELANNDSQWPVMNKASHRFIDGHYSYKDYAENLTELVDELHKAGTVQERGNAE